MPRKPTETVQVNLRIKESERRKLEAAAERNHVSLNAEMAARLQRSLEQRELLTMNQVFENVERGLRPLLNNIHELNKSGDLIRAVDALIDRILPLLAARVIDGREAEAINLTIGKVQSVKRMIEIEAGQRLRRMHTTGEVL
jgi:hypothetical protein